METNPSKDEEGNIEPHSFWGRAINIGIFIIIIFLVVYVLYISVKNSEPELINVAVTSTRIVNNQSSISSATNTPVTRPSATSQNIQPPTSTSTVVFVPESQDNYDAQISCRDISKVNLRKSPGYVGKNDKKDVVTEIPCDEVVVLLRQTKYVDDLTWWKVNWSGYEGWMSDHTGSGKLILVFSHPTSFSNSDPAEFVFWYFNAVWQERKYDFLWQNFMTVSFQNHSSSGSIKSYSDWWDSVKRLDVNSIRILENNKKSAVIRIKVTFYLVDKRVLSNRSYDYALVFDSSRKIWMFDYR